MRTRTRRAYRLAGAVVLTASVAAVGATTAGAATSGAELDRIVAQLAPIPLDGVPGEPIVLDDGTAVPGVPAPTSPIRGGRPAFAVPSGGLAQSAPEPQRADASRILLRRADGSVYAHGVLNQALNKYESFRFYDEAGEPILSVWATLPASTEGQGGTFGAHQRRATLVPRRAGSATARVSAARGAVKKAPLPANRRGVQRANAWCGSGTHAAAPYVVAGGSYPFFINHGTAGAGLLSLLYGADNWNSHQNHCGAPKNHNLQLTYHGDTVAGAGVNGQNTVLFGDATGACGVPAVGCALVWHSGGVVNEADIIMSSAHGWQFTGGSYSPSLWDVEGVSTHEFGHVIGHAHVSHPAEVMRGTGIAAGDITDRMLGRGDQRLANARY